MIKLYSFSKTLKNLASLIIRLISFCDNRPKFLVIVILFCLPVLGFIADTFKMPFASISNVTANFSTPRGAGGIPVNLNLPNKLLSMAMGLGIKVSRSIIVAMTSPITEIPNDRGVTSRSETP
ncbi:hypothetical protein DERF_015978 [Dermatophagoides farinae]|uniref:Uncharacterized protein n=1 Tax=Dermatophagoides farinae TaxID=6954 RepID=A0A922KRX2_DERFA|nr:hypothetical protein DERF_015978 [Dermatophagoides farinae]